MQKCESSKPQKVLTVTQIDAQTLFSQENLENKQNVLCIYMTINNGWAVKPLSTMPVKDAVRLMNDHSAAFVVLGYKEPTVETPSGPGEQEGEDAGDGN